MDLRVIFRSLINPWVVIGSIVIGVLLLVTTLIFIGWTRPGQAPVEAGTAVFNVIPAPTETLQPATATPPLLTPTAPLNGDLSLGAVVQVSGTGGAGLRLRFTAGLQSDVRLLGREGEIFLIKDGPEQADNYVWWYLESLEDNQRRGWAVADFLTPGESP
jgi:hypothetical protein